jgi:hypothetical protein
VRQGRRALAGRLPRFPGSMTPPSRIRLGTTTADPPGRVRHPRDSLAGPLGGWPESRLQRVSGLPSANGTVLRTVPPGGARARRAPAPPEPRKSVQEEDRRLGREADDPVAPFPGDFPAGPLARIIHDPATPEHPGHAISRPEAARRLARVALASSSRDLTHPEHSGTGVETQTGSVPAREPGNAWRSRRCARRGHE